MNRLFSYFVASILIATVLSVSLIPARVSALSIVDYGPKQGKTGTVVNIIGNGFSGITSPVVKYGTVSGVNPSTVKNDQIIKSEVPTLSDGVYPVVLEYSDAFGTHSQLIGGFTVGPPVTGLVVESVFPNPLPQIGGDPVYILGSGFTQGGRLPSPVVEFTGCADALCEVPLITRTFTGTTVDNSLISVDPGPGRADLGDPFCFKLFIRFELSQAITPATFEFTETVVCP